MADYRLTDNTTIVRASDGAFIPADPGNRDYRDYLAWVEAGGVPEPYVAPAEPAEILSEALMAQFTADDAAKIQAAVSGSAQFWLLWSAMQAQKDPMGTTNARFLQGWGALVQVLGQQRMDEIAAALGVKIA